MDITKILIGSLLFKHNIGYGKHYELDSVDSLYSIADLIKESAIHFVE